jgi:SAM-dependent methyltransferase
MPPDRDRWLTLTRETWNERATWWDECSELNAHSVERTADLARTTKALRLRPGATVLDAGCGSGQFAVAFAELGCLVTGIDVSPEMLSRARAHAVERGVSVAWRDGDLAHIADPTATYDAIHARVSLQFMVDLVATLGEFRRVLKPAGRLFASVPGALSPIYGRSWRRFLEPEGAAVNFVTPWELEALLVELDWRLIDGWGEFGQTIDGVANPLSARVMAGRDRRLRQAAATTWAIIAE